ncbi:MAG: aspartate-semialdehyde dehydrogenase [Gemmatimonadetes bacterium]|nr:aspartate-semialdehyde dehydrogenase [Gemmatimonadota bacterium]
MSAGRGPRDGRRWPVAVLGATGAVGQTFIRLLADHPWFAIAEVAASERSAGRAYRDAAQWLEGPLPAAVAGLVVKGCHPDEVLSPIVFSALDSGIAGSAELAFARAGRVVLSNARNHRMDFDVPLVVPDVNADHLAILAGQRAARGWTGALVTNANCAATVAAMALAPLHRAFGLKRVFVTTLQAISGAGYPGVPSLDILGSVIPYIADEEPKIEAELPKILGAIGAGGASIAHATFGVSAQANRVPVEHGHTACLSIECERRPTPEQAEDALRGWTGPDGVRGLPSAPAQPLVIAGAPDRPQARRDVHAGRGMSVTVGRVRPDPLLHLRLVALGHNTVVGAAGASILNAEWLASNGVLGT